MSVRVSRRRERITGTRYPLRAARCQATASTVRLLGNRSADDGRGVAGARRTETRSPTVTTSTWTVGRRRFKAGGPGKRPLPDLSRVVAKAPVTSYARLREGSRCAPSRIHYLRVSHRHDRHGSLPTLAPACQPTPAPVRAPRQPLRPQRGRGFRVYRRRDLWRSSANGGQEHLRLGRLEAYPGASRSRFAFCGKPGRRGSSPYGGAW